MDDINYTIEDLILDESFKDWVLGRNETNKKVWDRYINIHPEKRGIIDEACCIIHLMEDNQITINQEIINSEFEKISEFYQATFTPKEENKTPAHFSGFSKIAKIAASLLIFIALGITSYFLFIANEQVSEYLTESNQIKEIKLPDGSVVFLNQNSRLIFNKDWQKTRSREATLFGEAYFQVSKTYINNEKIKFTVRSGELLVEVLGTSFNVSNHGINTTVALNSGKVQISAGKSSLSLKPGEVIEYQAKRQHFVKKTEGTQPYTSWLKGIPNNPIIQEERPEKGPSSEDINNSNNKQNRGDTRSSKRNIFNNSEQNDESGMLKKTIIKNTGSDGNIDADFRRAYQRTTKSRKTREKEGEVSSYYITSEKVQVPPEKTNKLKIFQKGDNNEAYIDQIGEGLKSRQVQDGKYNKATAQFKGKNIRNNNDDYEWTTHQEQHGEGNVSIFHLMESYNSNLYSMQKGTGNITKADVEGEENILFILQDGKYNEVNIRQDGNNNEAGLTPLDPGILQKGNFNEADIIQKGDNNKINVNQQGNNNKTNIKQNDNMSF